MPLIQSSTYLQQKISSLSIFSSKNQLFPPSTITTTMYNPPCSFVSPKSTAVICCSSSSNTFNDDIDRRGDVERSIRLGLPSKGRMADETLQLLKDCHLSVKKANPRQYVAKIPQLSNLEIWFQRPKDIVRKLVSGDLDLGIVGFDTFSENGMDNEDLIIVHDALNYGHCRLSIAIPKNGIFENINSLSELAQMPQWTAERPLRVATGFTYLGPKFMRENGLKYVTFSTADGALEAAPAMGIADVILDLVSSGTTLEENNLKEIEGGIVLESQAVLVASKKALTKRDGVLDITEEIVERFEAHFRAVDQFMVTANIRGSSAEEVAERVLSQPSLSGLQGPTISPVGNGDGNYYAITICVQKTALYKALKQLRAIGGSGVLVEPITYIFDEETPRWKQLLLKLGKSSWEELVGVKGEVAVTTIEKENPAVKAEIVLEGTSVSEDLRLDRVRVWVDKCGIVTKIPVIG